MARGFTGRGMDTVYKAWWTVGATPRCLLRNGKHPLSIKSRRCSRPKSCVGPLAPAAPATGVSGYIAISLPLPFPRFLSRDKRRFFNWICQCWILAAMPFPVHRVLPTWCVASVPAAKSYVSQIEGYHAFSRTHWKIDRENV